MVQPTECLAGLITEAITYIQYNQGLCGINHHLDYKISLSQGM